MLAPALSSSAPAPSVSLDGTVEGYASLFGEIEGARGAKLSSP